MREMHEMPMEGNEDIGPGITPESEPALEIPPQKMEELINESEKPVTGFAETPEETQALRKAIEEARENQ